MTKALCLGTMGLALCSFFHVLINDGRVHPNEAPTALSPHSVGPSSSAGSRPDTAPDVALDLLYRIIDWEFEDRELVATGRFLRQFESGAQLLADADLDQMHTVRRSVHWVWVEAPVLEKPDREVPRTVRIRLLRGEEGWKVEDVRCVAKRIQG